MVKRFLLTFVLITICLTASAYAYELNGGTVVTGSSVNFRSGPSTDSSVISTLYDGDRVAVVDHAESWYKVATDGILGYIHEDYLETQPIMNITPGGAEITTSALNLRSKPNTDSSIITQLAEGSVVEIIGINTGWFKVTTPYGEGYIHPDYVAIVPFTGTSVSNSVRINASSGASVVNLSGDISEDRKALVAYAETFLGTKYVYGGSSPSGFDCSGFTSYIFSQCGIKIQRTASQQYSSSVTKINKADLQPGDLVFFANGTAGKVGHVGIYVGGDEFIHASRPGDVVKYDSLDSTYYSKNYIGSGTVF